MAPVVPLKELVLIGGGHSHVQVLRGHQMNPLPGTRVTVVVDHSISVYSGMVPGFVAGQYELSDLEIDVRPLAKGSGARFIESRVERVDPHKRLVYLAGRPPIPYDFCSINIGSTVRQLGTPGVVEFATATRPIAKLCRLLDAAFKNPPRAPGPDTYKVIIVGGGAAGTELAFCLQHRLTALGHSKLAITVVDSGDRPVRARSPRFSEQVLDAASARGITFTLNTQIVEVRPDCVVDQDGERIESDLCLWVVGAGGTPLGADSGLPVDDAGFIWVDDTMTVEGHTGLFAVGDCAVMRSAPEIPKAGVYAVRHGPTLLENLRASVSGSALSQYVPQSDFFSILNLGDGTAIGSKWRMVAQGEWMFQWKDHLDRSFMDKFQVLAHNGRERMAFKNGMPPMPAMDLPCGGCAAKVSAVPLANALARLPEASADPSVTMGLDERDDAVAFTIDGVTIVQNIDAFPAFTDDPYTVGRAGAWNAMSDLYAKGVSPSHAMAIITVPEDESNPEEVLFQVLSGVRSALDEAGTTLLGGHTTIGPQLTVGLSVTGRGTQPLWRNSGLQLGDVLVLTRALGTGVLFHADMAGRAAGPWMTHALDNMLRGNAGVHAALKEFSPTSVTDITGFGLAGHLTEMLRSSGVSALIECDSIPALPGALGLLERGERSTFHGQNALFRNGMHLTAKEGPAVELLFDPQSCGGLLVGVPPSQVTPLLHRLHSNGETESAAIGTIVQDMNGAVFELF